MADQPGIIPDLAAVIWMAVFGDSSATARAQALLPRLGIGGNDSAGAGAIETKESDQS